MNKRLFALICSIILFQNVYNSDCSAKTTATEGECTNLAVTKPGAQTCVLNDGKCEEQDIPCNQKTSGATADLCKQLTTTNPTDKLCILKGTNACEEKDKCNKAKGKDDAACKDFPVENQGNVCKKDTTEGSELCKEVKGESTSKSSFYNLKYSLAFLIVLFLF